MVVIDNFSGRIDELVRKGRSSAYAPVEGFPGIRAAADRTYLDPMLPMLGDIFGRAFGFRQGYRIEACDFSIVSVQVSRLSPGQSIPHHDDPGPGVLALLHYTQGPESGGTAFYRQRRTGFESVRPERLAAYEEALKLDDREFGAIPKSYVYGNSERYEMIGEIEAQPDRAIIYRGRTLHSGIIPIEPDPGRAVEAGRMTINTFLSGR